MKRNLSILFIAVSLFALSANALYGQSGTGKLEGTWEMELEGTGLHFDFSTVDSDHEGKMTNSVTIEKSDLSEDNLIALVALDVSVEYIAAIQNYGFKDIPLSKLIGIKALKVDPAYIERMKKLSGGDLSSEDIMSFAALKIDEKYAEEMYQSGYKLSGHDLITFKAMGITPEYIKQMMSMGYKDISQDEIVQLKAQKIH